jgi:hypothetical protein
MVKFLVVAATAAVVANNWQDIRRFMTIRQISSSAHPERIPVRGRIVYPQRAAQAQPDGTGDFDSAQRGGPPLHSLAPH